MADISELKPNTKPLLLKRLTADGFDMMCLFILLLLVSFLVERTPLAATYKLHMRNYQVIEQETLLNNDPAKVNELLQNNQVYQDEVFTASLHHYLLILVEALIACVILFLAIPLLNKDGLSAGKLLAGVMLFDESRQAKASRLQVLMRFMYGYFAFIVLYPWTGIYTILLIGVIRLSILLLNNKNKTLIDYLSRTMYIEKLSYRSFE